MISKKIKVLRVGSYPSKKKPGMGLALFKLNECEMFDTLLYSYKLIDDSHVDSAAHFKSVFLDFFNPVMPRKRKGVSFYFLQVKRVWVIITFFYNFWKTSRHESFDIVHVHSPLHFLFIYWANLRGISSFLTFHGTDFVRVRDSKIYQILLRGVKNINCVSQRHVDILKSLFPKACITLVSNGVDFKYFSPKDLFHSSDNVIVGVGTLRWHKGFDRLLVTFSKVVKQHPNWVLKIFGEGPDREKLVSIINEYDLKKNVVLPGAVSRKDLAHELLLAKIFVLSSVTEGLPKVLLEAMSAQCCCICFDVGDCERILFGSGLIVEPSNYELLSQSIINLIEQPELLTSLGLKASERAKLFSWEIYLDLHNRIYRNTLGLDIPNQD
jgi:glycosyltransferase involved in cell wall biosynthesis